MKVFVWHLDKDADVLCFSSLRLIRAASVDSAKKTGCLLSMPDRPNVFYLFSLTSDNCLINLWCKYLFVGRYFIILNYFI